MDIRDQFMKILINNPQQDMSGPTYAPKISMIKPQKLLKDSSLPDKDTPQIDLSEKLILLSKKEILSSAAIRRVKELESTIGSPVLHPADDVSTLLNICTHLTDKKLLEHSFTLIQALNEIKANDQKYFIDEGLAYIDIFVFSALGRCKSWRRIAKESKAGIPSLYSWFDWFKNENKESIDFYVHRSVQSKKDQKVVKHKQLFQNHHSSLLRAVRERNILEVEKLLSSGISVESIDPDDRSKTACHIACEQGDLAMVRVLKHHGCSLESYDIEEMTPVFYALASENRELIEYLISNGINIEHGDIQSRTPFYWACSRCSLDTVRYLYEKGCNVNTMSKLLRSPLSKSAFMGRLEIVDFLVSCPTVKLNETGERGRTALHMAVWGKLGGRRGKKVGQAESEDSPEVAALLLSKGADVNFRDLDGNTPLNAAAASFAEVSISVLIRFGADVDAQNNMGETPLYKASQKGYLEICKLLFNTYGANPFIKSQNNLDCFESAIMNQNLKVTAFFIDELKKKLSQDVEYSDQIADMIAVNFKREEAISLVKALLKVREDAKVFFTAKTLESLIKLKDKEILDSILSVLKSEDPKVLEEKIRSLLDIAFTVKWIYCFKTVRFMFPEVVSTLCWKITEISLDIESKDIIYLLENFNIDVFSTNAKNESIFHILIKSRNSRLLSCLIQFLSSVLRSPQSTEPSLNNIYLRDIDITTVASFLCLKDLEGHSAFELAIMNKYYDISTILKELMGQNVDTLFTIPPYTVETIQESSFVCHSKKERLLAIEAQLEDSNLPIKTKLPFLESISHRDLVYFAELCGSQTQEESKEASTNKYEDLVSSRNLIVVETEVALEKSAEEFRQASIIGIDMECYGDETLKTMFVCLLQISTTYGDYLIDCMKLHRLVGKYLQPIFHAEDIIKVFHGCDNDLKWLKANFDVDVVNLFDTSRAYMLITQEGSSVSLALLVRKFLGFELNKAYQRADWRLRPLPKVMIDYARKDSCVLLFLWHFLNNELLKRGNGKELIRDMISKMARKCWKTLEEDSLLRLKVIC